MLQTAGSPAGHSCRQTGIGVAVGNACPRAKDAADFVLNESNDEGGAGVAIETFVLSLK